MPTDMQFNRLQDSVHPVLTTVTDTKYQSISFSRKALLFIAVSVLCIFILTIILTHFASKRDPHQHNANEPFPPSFPTITTPVAKNIATGGRRQLTAEELRLPTDLIPLLYTLKLKTYLPNYAAAIADERNFTFDGFLSIDLLVINETDQIVLNANKLNLSTQADHYWLNDANDNRLKLSSINISEIQQMVIFQLDTKLQKGRQYRFRFDYSGPISSDVLSGLYVSKYMTETGNIRYLAVTQMEPTDARRMVPCFDEPAIKAPWKVSVEHPKGSIALSNGIEKSEAKVATNPQWLLSEFKETLNMSSYLLAIVVSDFNYTEGRTSRNTRFRIWARNAANNQTLYALQAGIKALEYFENFYNISFPLEKQDMIAIPDFEAGAMENWGLITYREKYLLYDDKLYSLSEKRRVAVVVAHELAHQWFGNLVTMKWWDDLWLNEGFATFMEYLGVDEISDGQFRMEDFFVIDAFSGALLKDQRATSHPLFVPIERSSQIYEVFDSISYDKGGSILRMMDALIGRENFKKGLNIYLKKFEYSNANNRDLWNSLSQAVPETVLDENGKRLNLTNFAESWTEQMGYPVVELDRSNGRIRLTQKRFKLDAKSKEKKKYQNPRHGYKWDIPTWYQINGMQQKMLWLRNELNIEVNDDDLLLINPQVKGFYRVNYDEQSWKIIVETLQHNHTMIDLRGRAQLINDAFTLAEANQLTYQQALAVTSYLHNETEYPPWAKALSSLNTIKAYYEDEAEYKHVQKYMKRLLQPLYNRLSWDSLPETHTNESRTFEDSLQASILAMYCNLGDTHCRNKASEMFQTKFKRECQKGNQLSSECSRVPLSVRKLVYCKGITMGGEEEWNFVFEMYKKEIFQLEKSRLMAALSCSSQRWILKGLLDMTVVGEDIRKQDAASIFYYVSGSDAAGPVMWDYLQNNWDNIYETYKDTKSMLKHVIVACTGFKSEHKIRQFEQFIKQHSNITERMSIFAIQLEKAHSNFRWMKRNFAALSEWFEERNAMIDGTKLP